MEKEKGKEKRKRKEKNKYHSTMKNWSQIKQKRKNNRRRWFTKIAVCPEFHPGHH